MLTKKLEEIKERCEKATEGPWADYVYRDRLFVKHNPENNSVFDICTMTPQNYKLSDLSEKYTYENDAKFIAHARTDVPMLLEVVESLIKTIEHSTTIDLKNGLDLIVQRYE